MLPYVNGVSVSEYDRKNLEWNLDAMRERLSLNLEETPVERVNTSAVGKISKSFEAHLKYGASRW